ncbi:unnamed protein product [Lactuca saligna]|uniref:Uncharacterized protein n=1 Tax=Lactuca saligna TaxID=75948 RepID=A0AA35ZE59_LACSI|nr:unnamed protein product [Lactuca saligna]
MPSPLGVLLVIFASLHEALVQVVGGLASETAHMISAVVKGITPLTYEFTNLVSTAFNVLPSSFLLFQRKTREIIKANLGRGSDELVEYEQESFSGKGEDAT